MLYLVVVICAMISAQNLKSYFFQVPILIAIPASIAEILIEIQSI